MIKEDFLTIPDAPEYEINSQLICRNKKTGQQLTLQVISKRRTYYSLRPKGQKHTLKRSPKSLRAQAVDAVTDSTFEPIPSLNNRYEINITGIVRNAQTKIRLKPKRNTVEIHTSKDGYFRRSIADLLWEVHGKIIKRRFRPVPCAVENAHKKFFFPNMVAAAKFLAPKIYLTAGAIEQHLNRRESEIYGWKITYLDDDLNHCDWALRDVKTPRLIGIEKER